MTNQRKIETVCRAKIVDQIVRSSKLHFNIARRSDYSAFEQAEAQRKGARITDPQRLSVALQSLSRHAHRSKPGLCKCRLQVKSQIIIALLRCGVAAIDSIQVVNGRQCYSV